MENQYPVTIILPLSDVLNTKRSKYKTKEHFTRETLKTQTRLVFRKWYHFHSCFMDVLIDFENSLYGDTKDMGCFDTLDSVFVVDRIVVFPSIRPFCLDKVIEICAKCCSMPDFRGILLEKLNVCPVLIYHLHKKGVLVFEEIEPYLVQGYPPVYDYYFMNEIRAKGNSDNKDKTKYRRGVSYHENDLLMMFEYGFHPSTIEYCLKYDDIDSLRQFNLLNQKTAKWSPFEWSRKPPNLDFLSFSVYFGSIWCFKHLIMNGFEINDKIRSLAVCCGSLDMFHLCNIGGGSLVESLSYASKFCRKSFIKYFLENGVDINGKDELIEQISMAGLLFIMLHMKVILELSHF